MPRVLRTSLPDGYFHLTARGVERRAIYLDADDYRSFLALFGATVHRHCWDVYAFCLMPNHYHVVLETARGDLSEGVRWLDGIYAQTFNARYGRWGHLFGARFGSEVVDSEDYLYGAARYVLANPVRAGLVKRADDWPWSGSRWGKRLT